MVDMKRAKELFEILYETNYERFLWFEEYLTAVVEKRIEPIDHRTI